MSRDNLINLTQLEPERARAIRSLGGKARQEQRKRQLSIHNFFKDSLKIDNYFNYELEKILDSKLELNEYQKKTIKNEFIKFLLERGYIRTPELTEGELKALSYSSLMDNISQKDLLKYFKTRTKKPHKKRRPKASIKQRAN